MYTKYWVWLFAGLAVLSHCKYSAISAQNSASLSCRISEHGPLVCGNGQAHNKNNYTVRGTTTIYTSAKPGESIYKAIEALQRDIKSVLGGTSVIKPLTALNEPGIIILNSQKDRLLPPITGWEAHQVSTKLHNGTPHLIAQGADMRGTIYAIYTLSEKILGVPPLWFFSNWKPKRVNEIVVPLNFEINIPSPTVKYRAWFPNDMDLLSPWRKLSQQNNEIWLETALRLKINTIEWFDGGAQDFSKPYTVSPTARLIHEYGLVNTTHHHSPLNASLSSWDNYWKQARGMTSPELSLKNQSYLEEFWRYTIQSIIKEGLEMLWVIGFRGAGDNPFWTTFKDAPTSMRDRAGIINSMMERQRDLVLEATGNKNTPFRTIFYNELSDLLDQGYLQPPRDPNVIWTFVAARRDHYPNKDIQHFNGDPALYLGYYMNLQFTLTGSHLAAAEGPWKMEDNFRYVSKKTPHPLTFSVVNAGNIREYLVALSAYSSMMWNFKEYTTDSFIRNFAKLYFGPEYADDIANLYKEYFDAYWTQKKPDLKGFKRQYIFQDLRYKKALERITDRFFDKKFNPNPLKDISTEQIPDRTFSIVPKDNHADNQIDAVLYGTRLSGSKFREVAQKSDVIYNQLDADKKQFFNDTLRAPAYFMYYLNDVLRAVAQAYTLKQDDPQRKVLVANALNSLKNAQQYLYTTAHDQFSRWYEGDTIFDIKGMIKTLEDIAKNAKKPSKSDRKK